MKLDSQISSLLNSVCKSEIDKLLPDLIVALFNETTKRELTEVFYLCDFLYAGYFETTRPVKRRAPQPNGLERQLETIPSGWSGVQIPAKAAKGMAN